MQFNDINQVLEKNYDKNVTSIEKVKNVYKICCDDKNYCLKVIKYDFGHFIFILSAIKHLQKNGFKYIPEIIKTNKNKDYVCISGSYAYLTLWVESRHCNYENPIDMIVAASKLAELHDKSFEFEITDDMNPRIGWFKWIETFKTRKSEIFDFRRRILEKENKSQFDIMYLDMIKYQVNIADSSVGNLAKSDYIECMSQDIKNRGFCHHDFANHNILISSNGQINIIDFDYCILDSYLHDVGSLLIRKMKGGNWSINNALFVLDAYNVSNRIKQKHIPILAAFIEFPQDYWQIGIQYYWEKQPWSEETFIKKLKKIYDDDENKQDFVRKFSSIKYN
ncbi:CotS family spore coat protein [Clostridium sp. JN-1]|uniref:CotS family spore coat protein n=1 Tax=Clostridium sp. JN-1 TaxID=2483110 RepID=UPI000F0B97AF|nr:CotS family spore coat protein [Clostridium sp. JN-1]